jgi:hypothetical protein
MTRKNAPNVRSADAVDQEEPGADADAHLAMKRKDPQMIAKHHQPKDPITPARTARAPS